MHHAATHRFAWPIAVVGLVILQATVAHASDRATQSIPRSPARPTFEAAPPALNPPAVPEIDTQRSQSLVVPEKLRLLVVAPHPDDETLGAGGLIQRALARGGSVRVLFVTNGDGFPSAVERATHRQKLSHRDYLAYGERRHREALHALRALAGDQFHATFLGFPDDGIDDLWSDNWSESRPYRSPFTESDHPPYAESQRQGIDYSGIDLRREVRQALQDFAPDWIVIPDPRDRHPDHCTTGGFVLDALRELRETHVAPFTRTQVLTYLVHYPEYPGNPMWQRMIKTAGIGGSTAAHESLSQTTWLRLDLSTVEVERKQAALREYRTQVLVMDRFLALFVRPNETFGRLDGVQVSSLPLDYARHWRPHRTN